MWGSMWDTVSSQLFKTTSHVGRVLPICRHRFFKSFQVRQVHRSPVHPSRTLRILIIRGICCTVTGNTGGGVLKSLGKHSSIPS